MGERMTGNTNSKEQTESSQPMIDDNKKSHYSNTPLLHSPIARLAGLDLRAVTVLMDGKGPDGSSRGVWIFGQPTGLIEARTLQQLWAACTATDEASRSYHAIVLADYEVGSWFEPRLKIDAEEHSWAPFQAWLFSEATWLPNLAFEKWLSQSLEKTGATKRPSGIAAMRAELSELEYLAAVQSALEHIACGDIYQVNLTWRIDFTFFGSSLALYRKLRQSQPVNHGAYLLLPERTILSLSPELFLERCGDELVSKPMKGTRARAGENGADQAMAKALQLSEKDQAENLMIVDLIRNDLGKIAQIGSVQVDRLFAIEQYPTVYQMVSQVSGRVPDRSLFHTLNALFPSGSVTGAPKIRAMEIISRLERSSRGIYTGAIGHIKPGGDFAFNVAIRTIELMPGNRGRLHVGSGIVADSSANSEYAECWSKARFLTELRSDFALLETLLLEQGELPRLDAHLNRLKASARFFGFDYSESHIRAALHNTQTKRLEGPHRVRLTLDKDGKIEVQVRGLIDLPEQLSFIIAPERLDSSDPLLRHKTTARSLYDSVLHRLKTECFDALFLNEREELTEGARSNVFLLKNGEWFTPPVESGLLDGVMRQEILRTKPVHIQKLYRNDLLTADAVFLSNALRGLVRVSLPSATSNRIGQGVME
jgi:para-aminobenzoate synthetase / 4-amino-4-deoxychorismate lyase